MAAGTASTDAVNVSQLQSVISGFGGGASFDAATGMMTMPTYTVAGATYNTVGQALAALDGGWNLRANGGASAAITAGDTVSVNNGSNILITQSGQTLTIATSMTPSFATLATTGDITAGGTINANGGLAVAGGQTVNMGGNRITKIGAGTVTSASTDAINGAQLHGVGISLATALGGLGTSATNINARVSANATSISNLDGRVTANATSISNLDGRVTANTTSIASLNTSIADATIGPVQRKADGSLTLVANGKSAANPGAAQVLTNLAAGKVTSASTDAVNGSQIHANNQIIASYFGGATAFGDSGWTTPSFVINTYAADGSATQKTYGNVNDALGGLNTSIGNVNARITSVTGGDGIKYFHASSTLADSTASGVNSVAIGPAAKAVSASSIGNGAVALGDGTSATGQNSLALGANSVADRANTVSVGSSTAQRQIIYVAKGTADTDAVNVSQLRGMPCAQMYLHKQQLQR